MRQEDQTGIDAQLSEREWRALPKPRLSQIECTYEQMDTSLHAVCGALVEILGPVFWAMLLVTFVHAELFGN
jgi:hypothetical protein